MKLDKLDKKIINFIYPLQQKPEIGYAKGKGLLQYLQLEEENVNKAINKLILQGYIIKSEKNPSHTGVKYELTTKGIEQWGVINKTIFEKMYFSLKTISIIAIIGFLIQFILNLYSNEIKNFLNIHIFN